MAYGEGRSRFYSGEFVSAEAEEQRKDRSAREFATWYEALSSDRKIALKRILAGGDGGI